MGVLALDYDGAAYIDFESFENMNNMRSSVRRLSSRTAYNLRIKPGLQL